MPVSTLSNSSSTQLLFASANSAAIALAEEIGGTESKFADMMKANSKTGVSLMPRLSMPLVLIIPI